MKAKQSGTRVVRLGAALALCLSCTVYLRAVDAETTNPTAAILQQPRFREGLVWVGDREPGEIESSQLLEILNNLNQPSWPATVEQFLQDYPHSPWAASLHHAYASFCRRTGRTTKALRHWEAAWALVKEDKSEPGKSVGGAVLASWTELLSSLGRLETLRELVPEGERWPFVNRRDRERFQGAKSSFYLMQTHPGVAYRCGTLALKAVGQAVQPTNQALESLVGVPSPTNGFSVAALAEMAEQHGLNLRALRRTQGQELIVPSVVHWRQNHYAAILDYQDGSYLVSDPTFGEPKFIASEVINEEASGVFLVPDAARKPGWIELGKAEADRIHGQGLPNTIRDGQDKGCRRNFAGNIECPPCKGTPVDGKNQTTRWKYDEYGRVTNKLDQAGSEILRYTYDANSRLASRWSAAKGTTYYTNDALGNLTKINYPTSADVTFQYDWLNRLTNMADVVGTTKFTYASGGHLQTEDGPSSSDTVTTGHLNRLRTSLSLAQPTGSWTNGFRYDAAWRLTNVTSKAGSFDYAYSWASPLPLKLSLPNTSYITNAYDTVARLLGTWLKKSDHTTLDAYTYIHDPANQRTNVTRTDGSTVAYTYDPIGQLKVANSSVNAEDTGYLYDPAWNLDARTNNGVLGDFTVDAKNHLTVAPARTNTYDNNGNLTLANLGENGWVQYSYDDENRLIELYYEGPNPGCEGGEQSRGRFYTLDGPGGDFYPVLLSQFAYDGFGRLRVRTEYTWNCTTSDWDLTAQVRYVYDGRRVIQERDGNNTPYVSYTRGNDLSGSLEGAGGIGGLLSLSHGYSLGWNAHNFYHADGGGNITYLVSSSQGLAASYRYDPYGNLISSSGTLAGANLYRFSSKEIHVNSGLYYYGFRFYDPNLQRWLNRDPIGEAGGINLYGFVGNSPLNYGDAFGLAYSYQATEEALYQGRFEGVPGPFPYIAAEGGGKDRWFDAPVGIFNNTLAVAGNSLLYGSKKIGEAIEALAGLAGSVSQQLGGSFADAELFERSLFALAAVTGPKGKPCPPAKIGPNLKHLDEVMEEAARLEKQWPQQLQALEKSGQPLAALTSNVKGGLQKLSKSSGIHHGELSRRFHQIEPSWRERRSTGARFGSAFRIEREIWPN